MSNNVTQKLATTAFNELKAESLTPVVQISAEYGILGDVFTVLDTGTSGTVSVVDGMYNCQSGVASDGLAAVLSQKFITNRPGQGSLVRFSAKFNTPQPNSLQNAGMLTSENQLVFSYRGTDFGITYGHDGEVEIQELTIVSPAAGAESATITIDGTPYIVLLTSGTVQHNAWEIAESLNSQVANYDFSSNNDTVISRSLLAKVDGAYGFSSITAIALWSQVTEGVPTTQEFIPQADWNGDTRISSDPLENLNPLLGNEYEIQYESGFGNINFFVYDNDTDEPILVHTLKLLNTLTQPNMNNPSFRIGWVARNLGNTSNITMQGSWAAGFIEGDIVYPSRNRSESHDQLAVGLVETNIMIIRNRLEINGKANRAEILPTVLSFATQTSKSAFFESYVNPVFSGDLDFQYIDKANSIAEIAKDDVSLVSGQLVGSKIMTNGPAADVKINEDDRMVFSLPPGQSIAIVSRISQTPVSDMQLTLSWIEDL